MIQLYTLDVQSEAAEISHGNKTWPIGGFQKQLNRFLNRRAETNEVKAAVLSRRSSAAAPALPVCFYGAEIHREKVFKIEKPNDFEVRTHELMPGLRKSQTCFKLSEIIEFWFTCTKIPPWTQISWY